MHCVNRHTSRPRTLRLTATPLTAALLCVALLHVGCGDGATAGGAREVVLYTSVDEPVARPILDEFTRRTGVRVALQGDTEANKSAGLVARLEAERGNPRADVWWGNEVFRTIALADAGVLQPYASPAAADIPPAFKDPAHLWAGTALRARVIALHGSAPATTTGPVPAGVGSVASLADLLRPEFKDKVAIANPRAGTTSGHAAALYALWGKERADAFFRALRANGAKVVGGNADVAQAVARGVVLAGLTDNDDVDAAVREGGQIRGVLPDQQPGGDGTLTIPCTVALVTGARHADDAKKLIDYLLSPEVERRLIDAKFARYSVRTNDAGGAGGVKTMNVDYRAAAKALPDASKSAEAILVGR
jgi:iron(III) transport system substrate-binding protein